MISDDWLYQKHVGADIRQGEPIGEYHSDETHRSTSKIKTLLDSPVLYYQRYVTKSLPSPFSSAMSHGTLMHEWMEKGEAFLETLVSPPESTLTATGLVGKEAKKWAENEAPAGATVVSPQEHEQVLAEVAAILANPAAKELIDDLRYHELSVRWQRPDGHRLKCRYDGLTSSGLAVDLKTTKDENIHRDWYSTVLRYHYHLQDAWYRSGLEACGLAPEPLRFIVVSTTAAHDCQVVTLPEVVVNEGRRLMELALADIRVREDFDMWLPDAHGEVRELKFPEHVLRSFS